MDERDEGIPPAVLAEAEIGSLARRFARAYEALVEERRKLLSEGGEEAARRVRADDDPKRQRRALAQPADEVTWHSLIPLLEADPEAGWAVWERVKREALEELASGHRAALALCWDDSPWRRAQFLAIRDAFIGEWKPRGGIELTLIDQMAQAHSLYLHWTEQAHIQASLEGTSQGREVQRSGRWKPRSLSASEALDQSAQMAERWQKLFVRALRALRDLRRHAPHVVLAAPGSQVNVAHQQVNAIGGVDQVTNST